MQFILANSTTSKNLKQKPSSHVSVSIRFYWVSWAWIHSWLVMAQRRLPECTGPLVVNCFTMCIYEKCYRLGTFSMRNVTWKKCHQSWHWCDVRKKTDVRMAWQRLQVFSLSPQNSRENSLNKHSRSHQSLSSALRTDNILVFLSKCRKTVQYLAEADAPLVSSNSRTAPLTHDLWNK